MRERFTQWTTIPVRWRDMDTNNHVNSAVFFTYFEMARMQYFRDIGLMDLKEPGKEGPAVVSNTCNYRSQVREVVELDAGVRATEVRRRSFIIEYEIYFKDSDTLVADGSTVMAWIDYKSGKAVELPQRLRDKILELQEMET